MMKNFIVYSLSILMVFLTIGLYSNHVSANDNAFFKVFAQSSIHTTAKNNTMELNNISKVDKNTAAKPISLPIIINKTTTLEGNSSLLGSKLTLIKRTVVGDINNGLKIIETTPNQTIKINAQIKNNLSGNIYNTNSARAAKTLVNLELTDVVRNISNLRSDANFTIAVENNLNCTVLNMPNTNTSTPNTNTNKSTNATTSASAPNTNTNKSTNATTSASAPNTNTSTNTNKSTNATTSAITPACTLKLLIHK